MTRRPERLKATKVHAPANLNDKSEQQNDNQARHIENRPSRETKQKQDGATDECKLGFINVDKYNRTERQHESDSNSAFIFSKAPCQREKRKTEGSKAVTKTGVPKGFVTRKDMEERVNKRKGNDETKVEAGKNIGPPKGFVTRTEMEKRPIKKSSIKEEPQQRPSKSLSEATTDIKSKAESRVKDDSLGLRMKSGVKTGFQNKKTKSTKITPIYAYGLLPGYICPKKHIYQETGYDENVTMNKADKKSKHLFSKLENKTHGETGLQSDIHSTNSRLPKTKFNHIKGKTDNDIETVSNGIKHSPQGNRKSNEEFSVSRHKLKDHIEDRKKTGRITNEPEKMTSASTMKSNYSVLPRMTSTAIAKPAGISNALSTVKLDNLKILIMNANGKNGSGGSPAERRKKAIHEVVRKQMPNIVLFQEFSWVGITGKTWSKYPFPEQFVYKGHHDASIMYDDTCMSVQNFPAADIDRILSGLQSNANNRLQRPFPMDFNPVARMCMTKITSLTKPGLDFICISWHGKSNEVGGGKMEKSKKIEYFQYWMEFLGIIREKYKLPILAAGDYNVDMYSIKNCVRHPFRLCLYEASMRRTERGIVDFCIVTDDIEFSDISWVNLETDTSVFSPYCILDHDPIVGSLTASMLGASEVAMGLGKRQWPSPISKYK